MIPNREYINKLLIERNWSDSELARQMGISRTEANRFMNGKRKGGGQKFINGLIRAFPTEEFNALFIFDAASPISNKLDIVVSETIAEGSTAIKNLNNSLVAKLDIENGIIEVINRGYITHFRVPKGTEVQVTHYTPKTLNT